MPLQSILFKAQAIKYDGGKIWTKEEAEAWLKKHGKKYDLHRVEGSYHHFRQLPAHFTRYRDAKKKKRGIILVYGWGKKDHLFSDGPFSGNPAGAVQGAAPPPGSA